MLEKKQYGGGGHENRKIEDMKQEEEEWLVIEMREGRRKLLSDRFTIH